MANDHGSVSGNGGATAPEEELVRQTLEFLAHRGWNEAKEEFLGALVAHLAEALSVRFVFVGRLVADQPDTIQTIACCAEGSVGRNFSYRVAGTPCEQVLRQGMRCIPEDVRTLFPDDGRLADLRAESYAGAPLMGGDGEAIGLIAVIHDRPLHRQRSTEALLQLVGMRASDHLERETLSAQLRESRERFHDFARVASDWFWETDSELRYVWISDDVYDVVGVEPEWHYGKTPYEIMTPVADPEAVEAHRQRMERREAYSEFLMHRRSPAGDHWIRSSGRPFFNADGRFLGYRGTGRDVTDVVEAQRQVEQERALFRLAVENMSDGLALFDVDDRLVLSNEMFSKLNPDLARILRPGMTFEDMLRDNVAQGRILEAEGQEEAFIQERLARHFACADPQLSQRRDGRWLLLREVRTAEGGVILINTDLTDIKNAEERLRRSQRMEAIGQLTGGVAHDFNNLLATMFGAIEILADEMADKPVARRFLSMLERSVERGAGLTDRLLAFARKQALEPKSLHLERIVGDMQDVLKSALGENVEIVIAAGPGLWLANADATQFENALLNLAINARDAMPDGGRLTISLQNVRRDAAALVDQDDVVPGDFVRTTIADTGHGISADQIDRVFEPFFTTKDVGQGVGLGLSMVYGFARQSGGFVEVESRAGEGAAFSVYLPRAVAEEASKGENAAAMAPGGGERVLLVEDDGDVRDVTRAMLQSAGYVVVQATNGPDALAIFAADTSIDLLISDVGLPGGMSGDALVRAAADLRPGLKAMLISGYLDEAVAANAGPGAPRLLRKPFQRAALLKEVREILDVETG